MPDSSIYPALPPGFRVRSPHLRDLPAVFPMLVACDTADLGTSDTVLEDLREEWEDFDLEHDAFLVIGTDSQPVALATVEGQTRMQAELNVHPGYRGLGIEGYLRHRTEARARERARGAPDGEAVTLHAWVGSWDGAGVRLLRSMGYELAERYHRMRIDIDEPPPEPEWPEGIEVRTAVGGEDERAVYELLEDANSDDPGHEPMEYERWLRLVVDTYRYDPSLWFLAVDGAEIAGAALGFAFPDEGWVRLVGVRHRWRRKGIGTALLLTAFGEFRRRGHGRVELGVDPDSPYGAQQLYRRAGMRVAFELTRYRKELRQP